VLQEISLTVLRPSLSRRLREARGSFPVWCRAGPWGEARTSGHVSRRAEAGREASSSLSWRRARERKWTLMPV